MMSKVAFKLVIAFVIGLAPASTLLAQTKTQRIAESLLNVKATGSKCIVTLKKSTKYQLASTTLPQDSGSFFSEIIYRGLQNGHSVEIDNTGVFWFFGKDTVTVVVMAPKNSKYYPLVFVDGVSIVDRKRLDQKLWSYKKISEAIREHYESEDEDN